MLTRKRWTPPNIPPSLAPEVQQYLRDQNKSISDYLLSLEAKGSIVINEAEITASQGIIFPSGTLDDYTPETSYTPTITAGSGSFTTVSATGKYSRIGNLYAYLVDISITTNGTAATSILFTPPFSSDGVYPIAGFETNVAGYPCGGYLNGAQGIITAYDGTYPGGSGRRVVVTGFAHV